jgi:hypothetical protein
MQTGFPKAGDFPTLFAVFLYFSFIARVPSLTVYFRDQHGLRPIAALPVFPAVGMLAAATMLAIAACGADARSRPSFTAQRESDGGE